MIYRNCLYINDTINAIIENGGGIMANVVTPVQALAVMTDAYKQATGRTDIDTIDATNFANVAAIVKGSDTIVMDNFVGTINLMLFDTIFAVREYDEKLTLLNVTKEQWGAAYRKISFLWKEGDEVQFRNTDQHTTVFKDGETVDMYKIKKGECITMFITGKKSFQDHITIPDRQLDQAFESPEKFAAYINAMLVAFANKIRKYNEEWKRVTLANRMATAYLTGMGHNLLKEFNEEYGESLKVKDIKTTYLPAFSEFLVEQVKNFMEFLTELSTEYHDKIAGNDIDRHTPKGLQRMLISTTWVNKIEARVYPNLFNVQWAQLSGYEKVNFWQSIKKPNAIDITPNIMDPTTGKSKDGDTVKLSEVIGCLYDAEAIGITENFQRSYVTPYNSAGEYRNQYFNWDFNSYQDQSENFILLYVEDEEEPTPTEPSITLNKTELSLVADATETLTATTVPADAEVSWSSSDETAATVSDAGLVTAVAEGTATITASITVDGETYSDTCAVTVTAEQQAKKKSK